MAGIKRINRGGRSLVTSLTGVGRPAGRFKRGLPSKQINQMQKGRQEVMNQIRQREYMRLQEKGYTMQDLHALKRMKEKDVVANLPISANTLRMLDRIKQIQNKGKIDNLEMQRRLKERRIVNHQMSLLKTPSLFGPESNTFDIFDDTGNPLKAPSVFKENPNLPNLLRTGRPSVLNTKETGADLHF